jgi:hypothetical protein
MADTAVSDSEYSVCEVPAPQTNPPNPPNPYNPSFLAAKRPPPSKAVQNSPFATEKPPILLQQKLYAPPTAKNRLVVCKLSHVADEVDRMHQGRLKQVLVFPLNPARSTMASLSSTAVEFVEVYEDRKSSNIQVNVIEGKKGDYFSIGYCELFGIVHASRHASDALRNPTTGVVVSSTVAGDAARLFANLIVDSIKSSKLLKSIKPKGGSARPKEKLLREFASIAAKADGLEAAEQFYYTKL